MDKREIDRLEGIAKIMGWKTTHHENIDILEAFDDEFAETITLGVDFDPFKRIDHAWRIVEKLRDTRIFNINDVEQDDQMVYCVNFKYFDGFHAINYEVSHKSAPTAICLAALKAVGIDVETENEKAT
ncbi:BC1872 family protein [Amphibacillus jilinensis]|uniref:BC1872 family protein n=1 Tax=Amphibacillus jilinensis TaxID=1216008 RepID=UPI0002F8C5B0|nr:hypothetical protein [Amphibacillus jilinensis]